MSLKEVNLVCNANTRHEYLKYFSDVKAQVNYQRDNLKSKIDFYYDELIANISNIEADCHKRANNIEKLSKNLKGAKKSIDLILNQSTSCTFNNDKFETVIIKTSKLKSKLDEKICEFKKILMSSSDIIFEPIKIEARLLLEPSNNKGNTTEIKGPKKPSPGIELNTQRIFNGSSILADLETDKSLLNLCEFTADKKFTLIYKASADGFDSARFHSKCNQSKATLTVIRTMNGSIFGGFTNEDWSGDDVHKPDPGAFIFSLINPANSPIRIRCTSPENAIYCHVNYGPTFGKLWSCDIYISDYSNNSTNSHSDLGISFEHPIYGWNSSEAQEFMTGAYYFKTNEIEVYKVEN